VKSSRNASKTAPSGPPSRFYFPRPRPLRPPTTSSAACSNTPPIAPATSCSAASTPNSSPPIHRTRPRRRLHAHPRLRWPSVRRKKKRSPARADRTRAPRARRQQFSASSSSAMAAKKPAFAPSLKQADFPGVLRGPDLFSRLRQHGHPRLPLAHRHLRQRRPSRLSPAESPAVVTTGGGPKYIVREPADRLRRPRLRLRHRHRHPRSRPQPPSPRCVSAARDYALTCSWDAVFDRVYQGYNDALSAPTFTPPATKP